MIPEKTRLPATHGETAGRILLLLLALAGCATQHPAPVLERNKPAPQVPVAAPLAKGIYVVKQGDTLYSIALDHGIDYRDIKSWNNLEDSGRIQPGQQLRLAPAATAPATAAPDVATAPLNAPPPPQGQPMLPGGAPGVPPVAAQTLPGAPGQTGIVSEPKALKLPYSDEAFAQMSRGEKLAKSEPAPAPGAETPGGAEGENVDWGWPTSGKLMTGFSEAAKGVDIGGAAGQPVVACASGKVIYSGTDLRGYGKLVIIKHNNTYLSVYAHNSQVLVKEGESVVKGQKIAEMGNSDSDQVVLHFEIRRLGKPVDPLKYLPAAKSAG